MSSIFGNIFDPSQLEQGCMDTLRDWMPTYLREIERQRGRDIGKIPPPKNYVRRNRFDTFPEEQLPLAVIISPGVYDDPSKEGDGTYGSWYTLGIGIVTNARTSEESDVLSKIYGAAAKAIMLQKSSLGGICSSVEWLDESYDDVPVVNDDRPLRAVRLVFIAYVDDIVTKGAGPAYPVVPDPVTQPGSTWPTADTIEVDTHLVGIDEEVQ